MIIETLILEDNKEYGVLKEIDKYIYLFELDNPDNICIRRKENIDNNEVIVPLKLKEEFYSALKLLAI